MRIRLRTSLGIAAACCAVGGIGAPAATADVGGATPAPAPTTTTAAPDGNTTTAPATVSPTRAVTLTRSQTKSVQRRIGVRADGAFGPQSRRALLKYQQRKRLTRTGKPNLETLRSMGLTSAATAIERKLLAAAADPTTKTPTAVVPVDATGAAAAAIAAAQTQLGTPYRSAGTAPGGFDCSGLVLWSYAQAGVKLPRTSFDQYEVGTPVARDAIQPGDLVFWSTAGPGASHVGIAISPTTVISATSHGVRVHEIFDDYWGAAYVGARRLS